MTCGGKVALLALCLALLPITVAAQDYCEKAKTAFTAGDYDGAEKNYAACSKVSNKNTNAEVKKCKACKALRQEADAFFKSGDYNKAQEQYRALQRINPSDPNAKQNIPICQEKIAEVKRIADEERRKREKAEKEAQQKRDDLVRQEQEARAKAKADAEQAAILKKEQEEKARIAAEKQEKAEKEAQRIQEAADKWNEIKNTTSIIVLDNFLFHYDGTPSAQQARERKKDIQAAERKAKEAENLNNEGKTALSQKRYKDALSCFRRSAKEGNVAAENNIGYIYELGLGVAPNPETAVKYYRSSAEKGFAQAEFNLARMYEKGKGVEKNMKLALDYYQRAANQGLLEAQQRLAELTF